MFTGMKRKDRIEHVKRLDVEWGYWNMMNEDQLRNVLIEKVNTSDDKAKAKIKKMPKDELIRKLVVHHVKSMI